MAAFVRHYILQTSEENAEALRRTLLELRDFVAGCPGSVQVDLLHAPDAPERLFFIEHWASKADHEAAGKRLPSAVMGSLKQLLVAPPQMADLVDAGHAA
ncbi:putative quinol monooxygenase [Sphingomonas jatrophae]|uniref:Antibiotic biosynthesis monooxygenase n=1 Tax=Sphingomonas jatrophae TaxID=1166337 RepID=A0A1I6KEJ3_9SPHN|nr:antibiotic biosynthesis monooxygenase family protein [Sphingomonas jatrophae]SFR89616.1 Antibiotic biosynthesis monooxygenase [Sphingomonas jatrophae]